MNSEKWSHTRSKFPGALLALTLAGGQFPASAAAPRPIALQLTQIDLPAAPAAIIPAELDGDGRLDLLIVTAYSKWGAISNDRVEDAVMVTEVVSALLDRREARAFLAQPGGGYMPAGDPLVLPESVLSIEAGPPGASVLALTDEGVSAIRWRTVSSSPAEGTGVEGARVAAGLAIEPLLVEPCAFAGSGAMLQGLDFVRDLDGDGSLDLMFPGRDGLAIFHGDGSVFGAVAVDRVEPPGDVRQYGRSGRRVYPLPASEDVTGDGTIDLVVRRDGIHILQGTGGGRFAPPVSLGLGCLGLVAAAGEDAHSRELGYFGDLDGDGRAEVVTIEEMDTGGSDLKQAKEPRMTYRVHRLLQDLSIDPQPVRTLVAAGYANNALTDDSSDIQFIDLDGDGRKDLVTVTLDFSVLQAVRILATKKISIGLNFHVFSQGADGQLREVKGQTLDETLRLDLNHLEISRLAQFQGDFDGDGRIDFVHLGRGKSVTIHRGMAGGRYSEQPDLAIELAEEPQDVMLVRVEDFDGDGRSDLAITRTLPAPEPGVSAPARVELRLSGAGNRAGRAPG